MKAEGQPETELSGMPLANREAVTPTYFATMGMTLRRGRFLRPSDREDAPPVVVINEALARFHWPGQDPVGKRLGYAVGSDPRWRTVVGVVANARYNELKVPSPAIYVPYRQIDEPPWYLLIRTAPGADGATIGSGLRREIHQLGLGLTLVSAVPIAALLAKPLGPATTTAALTLSFALVALVLATLGVYGVLSSVVIQRTREFGVRMALGADGRSIAGLVARQASRLIAAGVVGGLLASFVVGRGLSGFLYQVTPSDPVTLAVVAVVLALVSFLALLGPALRAARIDPIVSLRSE
jgi:putative ABC transport system permease protein